jgi:hypothetical protein
MPITTAPMGAGITVDDVEGLFGDIFGKSGSTNSN